MTLRSGVGVIASSYRAAAVTVPSAPTLTAATPGNTTVALTWTAPSNGGSAITDYAVEKSPNGTSSWTSAESTTSTAITQTITGLTNGTIQYFRVSAVNAIGTGAVSNVLSATPTSDATALTGRIGWWDASDAASFTYHSGALVSQWNDKSVSGFHMVQATSGNAPSRNVTSPSGQTAVRFAAKSVTTTGGAQKFTGTALTYVFVVKRDGDSHAVSGSAGPSGRIVVGYNASQPDYDVTGAMLYDSDTGFPGMYRDPSSQVGSSPSMAVGTWGVVIGTWDGTNFNFYVNGVNTGTVATTGTFNIFNFAFGMNNSGGEKGDNSLGEVVIYNRALNSTERTDLTSYLTSKWL